MSHYLPEVGRFALNKGLLPRGAFVLPPVPMLNCTASVPGVENPPWFPKPPAGETNPPGPDSAPPKPNDCCPGVVPPKFPGPDPKGPGVAPKGAGAEPNPELGGAVEPNDASAGVDPKDVEPKPCGAGACATPNPGPDVGADPN